MRRGIMPVLPIRRGFVSAISAWMIERRLASLTNGCTDEWVLWIRFPSPELVRAIRGLNFGQVVYEPVDHYAAEPLFTVDDRRRLAQAERELSGRAMIVTTSVGMASQFQSAPGGSHWLPIGTDASLQAIPSARLASIPRPRLGVVGSLDWLADEALLLEVATRRPDWQLVLAGPREGDWGRRLESQPNVHWLGTLKPEEARGVIAGCDVALNPCVLNEWTETALPVKVFDYLAEGRPVVSTPMAELDIFKDLVELVSGAEFVPAIERALLTDDPHAIRRRTQAAGRFTMQDRARRAFDLLTQTPTIAVAQNH
ncbi:MAG: glycosyltransferase [Candidatus Dormibacteraeota bacterium]|nr:glycosyltransferase [Candidatus Dormibacteraeota bacterium]